MEQLQSKKIKGKNANDSCNASTKTTVINGRRKKNIGIVSVYIGRPSIWGNPFVNKFVAAKYPWRGPYISVNDPVMAHKRWLSGEAWTKTLQKQRKEVLEKIGELKGKVLRCYCKPQPCHGDYLAELADSTEPKPIKQKAKDSDNECENANK